MENHENLIGKVLGGRYKIQTIVGEGGMSVVMKAYDALKMRDVTIKLLTYKNSSDPHTVERFTNEAKAVELLSHPNIVSVYDVSLEGASKYIVMEYINGITLKEYLDRKGRLEWHEAVHYINQVLSALSHAHEKGVIHRDIKPENVMLMRNGSIKVIDFGIAKLPDSKSLTVTDKAIGTVNYISPEQASGHGSTEKSDIYSTGIMLYELVTGQLPFVSASSVSVAMMHVSSEPAMPSSICDSIPVGLEQIIIKAMMKDSDKRFGSATAMKKALEYLCAYPATIFNASNSMGPDGKPILSTGASQNNGNNTVITEEVTPMSGRMINTDADDNDYSDSDNNDADEVEDEDEYDYVRPARSSMFPIILGVSAAFFTVLLLFGIFFLNYIKEETNENQDRNILVVPNLIGDEYNDALHTQLESEGYKLEVKRVANDKVPGGQIISQQPLADSTRMYNENGVKLTIEVSAGTAEIQIQDYEHYEVSNVRLQLENMGLKVTVEREFNDTVIADHIIRTVPEKGSIMIEGDSITLVVSDGPKDVLVEIPGEIIGLSYNQAERILQNAGINVHEERDTEYSDEYPEGTVMGTEPAIGTSVSANNDKVKLIISKGSEPSEDAMEALGTDNGYNPNDYYGKIEIKNYKHFEASNVKLQLENMGLNVTVEREYNNTVIADHVIRTVPAEGAALTEGDSITLVVSNGPDVLVKIPGEILGLSYNQAESILQTTGISVLIERGYEYSDKYPEGAVIGTEPAIGTSVSVNTGKVKLILSKGSDPSKEVVEADDDSNENNNLPTDITDTVNPSDDTLQDTSGETENTSENVVQDSE